MKHKMGEDKRMPLSLEPLEPRLLLDAVTVGVGDGANKTVTFSDTDGSEIQVSVNQGLADVEIEGDGAVTLAEAKGRATVTGTNLRLNRIGMTQADANTGVGIRVKGGDGTATLQEIQAAGMDLKDVKAPDVLLQDGTGLQADAVAKVDLAGASDTALAVANHLGTLVVGPLTNVELTADTGDSWHIQGDATDIALQVNTIGSLRVDGTVDPSTMQVLIEAKFVEIRDDLRDVDVNFAFLTGRFEVGGGIFDSDVHVGDVLGGVQVGGPVTGSNVVLGQLDKKAGFGDLVDSHLDLVGARSLTTGSIFGGILHIGALDKMFRTLALQDTTVDVISAPKVTVQNAQEATIDVADTRRFVTGPATDSTITLQVVPKVTTEGLIRTDITVQRAGTVTIGGLIEGGSVRVVNEVEKKAKFRGPIINGDVIIGAALKATFGERVADSTIGIKDGGTVRLKGDVERTELTIPIVGQLAVVGRLFRDNTVRTKRALVIRITPRLDNSTIDPISLGDLVLKGGMTDSVVVSDDFTGKVEIGDDMVDSVIHSGVNLGPDELFNSGDETWGAGHIADFRLKGNMDGSLVGVGVDPGTDGLFLTEDDVGIGGAINNVKFGSYTAGGGGAPADRFGLTALAILSFKANGTTVVATAGTPFIDGNFRVRIAEV